jgi:LemA protein
MFLIPIIILAVIALWVVSVYNDLVTNKTRIGASIQEIGNQLKRQSELIPNLEESAKGYLKHEKDILRLLADARKSVASAVSSGDLDKLSSAGAKVAELLPKIQVVVESNPQLKGADVVTNLMEELRDTSDKVMYSRRTLIDLTADYNIKLSTFPSNVVANLFSFKPETGLKTPKEGPQLEVSDSELVTPKVKL